MAKGARKYGNANEQVIELLNKLGSRMVKTEKDGQSLKSSLFDRLDSLEYRTDTSEKVFLSMQNKLSHSQDLESRIAKRQGQIEKTQKDQEARLQKATALTEQIEEAIAQQARMNRRLEKVMQDRSRLLGKLERIEDTVLETREALNSKALVLLADQDIANKSTAPQLPADPRLMAEQKEDLAAAWWDKPLYMQASAITVIILIAFFSAWGLTSNSQQDTATPANTIETTATQAPTQSISPSTAENSYTAEDLYEMNEETLIAEFNKNPDALAQALNGIEPGETTEAVSGDDTDTSTTGTSTIETDAPYTDNIEPVTGNKNTTTSISTQPAITHDDFDIDLFLASQNPTEKLSQRIKKDSSLPTVISEIEEKAFEGIPEAQHDLAAIYTAGHGGVKPSYERAIAWFTEAALNNIANARYNLGVLSHQGLGTKQDIDLAVKWYKTAAALDHPEAQYNLGIAYIEGIGTKYSAELAARSFEKAARGGIIEAAYNLGLIHENGLIGKPNAKTALYWYKHAAEQGSDEAQKAMDQLAKSRNIKISEIDSFVSKKKTVAPVSDKPAPQKPVKTQKQTYIDPGNNPSSAIEQDSPYPRIKISKATPIDENKDHAIVAQIQDQLGRLGLYPGTADGINGQITGDAIRSYQASNNLPTDARASEALLVHMLTNELGQAIAQSNTPSFDEIIPPGEFGSRED